VVTFAQLMGTLFNERSFQKLFSKKANMTFNDLSLMPSIIKAVSDQNYTQPTPIQQKAIPLVLDHKDVLACAQTGTGKTAAFAIPIIQHTQNAIVHSQKPRITSLILTPTRELAIQIGENIDNYSKYTDVRYTVIYGGVKQQKQVERLRRGVDILVATPGRLLDLMEQGYIRLDSIKTFVLDEADRMLDMGFIHDIKKIIAKLPNKRQSLFFSATLPPNIVSLSKQILTNPIKIEVSPTSSTADTVQQKLFYTNKSLKKSLLTHLIDEYNIEQLLLFVKTKHGADRVARDLKKQRINAQAIHGDKAQNQRQNGLKAFKEGKVQVLVATDIAARGIDIDKLQYVINYDIPNEPETYVHRIGRSGRAGESGLAMSICEPEENEFVRDIERLIKKKIKVDDNHPFPQTDKPMTAAEKKEWNKEKQRRKQEFFANRKKGTRGR
jgi:ATP-dependent RNA helicase RhlE